MLVKVHAASVNPADWHFMRGEPYMARLKFGLLKPKNGESGPTWQGRSKRSAKRDEAPAGR